MIFPETKTPVYVTSNSDGTLNAEILGCNSALFQGRGYGNEAELLDALRLTGMIDQSVKDRGFSLVNMNLLDSDVRVLSVGLNQPTDLQVCHYKRVRSVVIAAEASGYRVAIGSLPTDKESK